MKGGFFSWAARGFVKCIIGVALVVAVLTMVLGQSKGIGASGKAVDLAGTSTGAAVGFIPRFFDHFSNGNAAAQKDSGAPKAAAKS
jgi:hypothetical protein